MGRSAPISGVNAGISTESLASAYARDLERMQTANAKMRAVGVSVKDSDPWMVAAQELDVEGLYSNQTGPIDTWWRSESFLKRESLLRGMTPAELRCIQIARQADLLAQTAEVAFELSHELETAEAQRLLGDWLWSGRLLTESMQTDARANGAARDWSQAWGAEAVAAIDEDSDWQAKMRLRETYRRAVRESLARAGWPWDRRPTPLAVPSQIRPLSNEQGVGEHARRYAAQRARAQVGAVALQVIAENRVAAAREWRALLVHISGKRVTEFRESFGFLGLPETVWELLTNDERALIDGRMADYVTRPAGLERDRAKLNERLRSLAGQIQVRVIAESTDDPRLKQYASRLQTLDPTIDSATREKLLASIREDAVNGTVDLGVGAAEVAIMLGLFSIPEPVSKVIGVSVGVYVIVSEALSVDPKWQSITTLRLAITEGVATAAFGRPHQWQIALEDGTVVSPKLTAEDAPVLKAELEIWSSLRSQLKDM
jgi:hypothetical protein